jgi:hypothetical protein
VLLPCDLCKEPVLGWIAFTNSEDQIILQEQGSVSLPQTVLPIPVSIKAISGRAPYPNVIFSTHRIHACDPDLPTLTKRLLIYMGSGLKEFLVNGCAFAARRLRVYIHSLYNRVVTDILVRIQLG